MNNTRTIYRSRNDKVIAGVVGGFAKYFDINATILRLAVAFATVATGVLPGVVTYIIAMIIMPLEPIASTSVEGSDTHD